MHEASVRNVIYQVNILHLTIITATEENKHNPGYLSVLWNYVSSHWRSARPSGLQPCLPLMHVSINTGKYKAPFKLQCRVAVRRHRWVTGGPPQALTPAGCLPKWAVFNHINELLLSCNSNWSTVVEVSVVLWSKCLITELVFQVLPRYLVLSFCSSLSFAVILFNKSFFYKIATPLSLI